MLATIVHELAHYIFDWCYTKKRPEVKYQLGAIIVKDDPHLYTLKGKVSNHLIGVLAGLALLLIFQVDILIILIYIIMSGMDLASIWAMIYMKKEKQLSWNIKLEDIPCDRCKRLEQKLKEYETAAK